MLSKVLRWVGHLTPDIRYVRAIPNRILKPLHHLLGLSGGVVKVLGFSMRLEPSECIDGNLWFKPHLYDRREIEYLLQRFPEEGVFIDLGSNIGFWSLRFAAEFNQSRIYAIEANPVTFQTLCENIKINDYSNIIPINIGVSDEYGIFPLYCNDTGNRGGDSFSICFSERNLIINVNVMPLSAILIDYGIGSVDLLKIDVEGLEETVLKKFFSEAPQSLWPKFVCAEISHVPQVIDIMKTKGYRLVFTTNENCVFVLG